MIIYLYVKTHNKTGLKYLGKTIKKDPHRYHGSGIKWVNHLKKHGYDYTTQIIRECVNEEELKTWGIYYSRLWNIVESKEWANLMEEGGEGAIQSKETIEKRVGKNRGKKRTEEFRKNRTGEKNPFYQKTHTESTRQKMKDNHCNVSGENNPMYGKIHPNRGVVDQWKWNDESRQKMTGKNNPMYGKISPNKGKTPIKLECPHCKKLISRGNYTKWHGNKCKFNYKIS